MRRRRPALRLSPYLPDLVDSAPKLTPIALSSFLVSWLGRTYNRSRSRQSAGICAMSVVRRGLLSLMIMVALMGGTAQAEDLDQGKSGAKLFAANCAHCHRSPRGLAKERFSWTLSRFLQQHYTSGSASAQALTAFLQSVDTRAKSQPTVRNTRPPGTSTSEQALRPPAPVPAR